MRQATAYRLKLMLPILGFATGALLFCINPPVFIGLAIPLCLGSWIAGVIMGFRAKCPCGKSPFGRVFRGDTARQRPFYLPWPERTCSRCGREIDGQPADC